MEEKKTGRRIRRLKNNNVKLMPVGFKSFIVTNNLKSSNTWCAQPHKEVKMELAFRKPDVATDALKLFSF